VDQPSIPILSTGSNAHASR